jgi:hypothetical protein
VALAAALVESAALPAPAKRASVRIKKTDADPR